MGGTDDYGRIHDRIEICPCSNFVQGRLLRCFSLGSGSEKAGCVSAQSAFSCNDATVSMDVMVRYPRCILCFAASMLFKFHKMFDNGQAQARANRRMLLVQGYMHKGDAGRREACAPCLNPPFQQRAVLLQSNHFWE